MSSTALVVRSGAQLSRRALVFLVASNAAAGVLAACRAAPSTGGQPGTPQKQVEISIYHRQAYTTELDQQVFPPAYELFRQQTGITVNETILNEGDIPDKLTAAIAGGAPPDGSYVHPQWVASMASRGMLVPLESYIAKDRALNLPDIYPALLDYFRFPTSGGKLYGLPFYSGPSITVFNRALFEREGVPAPDELEKQGRWTWDMVREVSIKLTKGEGPTKTWGWDGITTALHFLNIIIWGYGGDLWDKDLTRTLLGEPPAVAALQDYADLRAKYNVVAEGPEVQNIPSSRAGRLPSGRVAARYGIKADIPTLAVGSGQGIVPGIAPIPKGPTGRFVRNGPNSFMIPQGSKHPDEVYRLIAWMTSMDFQRFQFAISATVAVRRTLMDSPEFQRSLQPWEPLAVWKEAAERDRALPMSARHSEIQNLFGPAYTEVKEGKTTVRQIMERLVPQINALLQEAKAVSAPGR
jgi:multiple sugar transport system substrate-binding protein